MAIKSWSMVMILAVGLAACDAQKSSKSDGLPLSEVKLDGRAPIVQIALGESRFQVVSVDVIVPPTLVVSEANLFYPKADIVWRGEPPGDRFAQIKAIVEDGLNAGIADLKNGPRAVLSVQMERFHALTEKARYAVGGVHDVVFVMTLLDAKTGSVLEAPRRIEIAIRASGNDKAIEQDEAGRTQRVVIVEGVAEAIRRELMGPILPAVPL